MDFVEFPKIARLSREIIITEKIDGTNASITITEDGQFLTGSRTRWVTPMEDNHRFAWHPRCGRHAAMPGNAKRQRTPISGTNEIPPPLDFDPAEQVE